MTRSADTTDLLSAPAALDTLPDDARAWLYVTAEPLAPEATTHVEAGLAAFFRDWRSHGRTVHGAAAVLHSRVIVVAAVLDDGDISGCGIDQHVRVLDRLLSEVGARHADTLAVAYRTREGDVVVASRPAFRAAEAAGAVAARLPREARTLGEVRRAGLQGPL